MVSKVLEDVGVLEERKVFLFQPQTVKTELDRFQLRAATKSTLVASCRRSMRRRRFYLFSPSQFIVHRLHLCSRRLPQGCGLHRATKKSVSAPSMSVEESMNT